VFAEEMQLERSFALPLGVDDAWDVLVNVDRLAAYVPGATLTEVHGDEVEGRVRFSMGVLGLTYEGEAAYSEKDSAARRVVIEAAGRDVRGPGTASATVTATLEPVDAHSTTMNVLADISLSGSSAVGDALPGLGDMWLRQLMRNVGAAAPNRGRAFGDRPFGTRPAEDRAAGVRRVPPPSEVPAIGSWVPYAVVGAAAAAALVWWARRRRR
jgi:carbon monoxide dehydrogenase subunit G